MLPSHHLTALQTVAGLVIPLYTAKAQEEGKPLQKISIAAAVEAGLFANQTHAYYLGRIWLFLEKIGIDTERLAFHNPCLAK